MDEGGETERITASHITPIRIYDISLLIDHKRNHIPTQVLAPKSCPRAEEKKFRIKFIQFSQYQVSTCHHPNYTLLKKEKREI